MDRSALHSSARFGTALSTHSEPVTQRGIETCREFLITKILYMSLYLCAMQILYVLLAIFPVGPDGWRALWRYRYGNVFGCDDFPFPIASNPGVGPDKVPFLSALARPGFAALNNRGVAEKSHVGVVEMI
jgi:hypothetical protein